MAAGPASHTAGRPPPDGRPAVQELAEASPDPAFGFRVHAGRPGVTDHGPDPGIGEDRVEGGREVRAAVADQELGPVGLLAEVHDQVACLLGCPFPGWMQSDSEDADAPGGVLYHGQNIGLGAAEQVGCEEVARQDRLGLGAQELRPGRSGSARCTGGSGLLQNLPHRRGLYLYSQAGQLAVDPPFGVLVGQPEDQGTDVPAGRRPVLPRMDRAAQRQRTMSRCQRTIVSGVTSSRSTWRRAFGITLSRVASSARSAPFTFGRSGCRRCSTASWCAGSRSLRSATPPHAGTAAAMRSPA
jgi:hypothetical protein